MLDPDTLHIISCVLLAIGMVLFVTRIFGANVEIAVRTGGVLGRVMHGLNVLQTLAFGLILVCAAFGAVDLGVAFVMILGILALDALGTATLLALMSLLGEKRFERLVGPLTEIELP